MPDVGFGDGIKIPLKGLSYPIGWKYSTPDPKNNIKTDMLT